MCGLTCTSFVTAHYWLFLLLRIGPRIGCYPRTAETETVVETSAETRTEAERASGRTETEHASGHRGPGKFSYVYKYEAGPPFPS